MNKPLRVEAISRLFAAIMTSKAGVLIRIWLKQGMDKRLQSPGKDLKIKWENVCLIKICVQMLVKGLNSSSNTPWLVTDLIQRYTGECRF